MNILLSEQRLDIVKSSVKKLLMRDNVLFVIDSIKTEVKTVEGFLGKKKTHEFITEATINRYNDKGQFLGTMYNENAQSFLCIFDLYQLRKNWTDFKVQLNTFGFKIIKTNHEQKYIDWLTERIKTTKEEKAVLVETPDKSTLVKNQIIGKGAKIKAYNDCLEYFKTH